MIYAKKNIMSFFSDKIPCLCSPKSLSPAPLPSKYYHFSLYLQLLVVCALSKERKWNKFQKKTKLPHPTGKKRKKS